MTCVHIEKQRWAALVFVLWLAVSAGAHIGDRVYPVAYVSDEMLEKIDLKDGSVDEWQELIGEPSMTMLDFTSLDPGISPDPSDLDFRIWLAWHDDPARFYVAFVASDDIYKNDHDYNAEFWGPDLIDYYNDCISVVIDGDHGGGAGRDTNASLEEAAEIRNRSQEYFAIARTREGPILDETFTRYLSGEFAWTGPAPLRGRRRRCGRRKPDHQRDRTLRHPVRPLGVRRHRGERCQRSESPDQVIGFGIMVYRRRPS